MATLRLHRLFARRVGQLFARETPSGPLFTVLPPEDHAQRFMSSAMAGSASSSAGSLEEHDIPYIAANRDTALVERWRKLGRPIYYGDASNPLVPAALRPR